MVRRPLTFLFFEEGRRRHAGTLFEPSSVHLLLRREQVVFETRCGKPSALFRISPSSRRVEESKSYLGRAVESRLLTFLLVEESRRRSSASSVDDRLGRSSSCLLPHRKLSKGFLVERSRRLLLSTSSVADRLVLVKRSRRILSACIGTLVGRAVLFLIESYQEEPTYPFGESGLETVGRTNIRAASRDVVIAPRAAASKLASTKVYRSFFADDLSFTRDAVPARVRRLGVPISCFRADVDVRCTSIGFSLSSHGGDGLRRVWRGKPRDRKAWKLSVIRAV